MLTSFSINFFSCRNDLEKASKSQKLAREVVLDVFETEFAEESKVNGSIIEPEADGDGDGGLVGISIGYGWSNTFEHYIFCYNLLCYIFCHVLIINILLF